METTVDPGKVFQEAIDAATAAFSAAKPTPMVVQGRAAGEAVKTYYVADGVCGFAWVNIRPARGKFVAFLKKSGIGYKGYRGGWQISVSDFAYAARRSQSYERKAAAASAAAAVLRSYGINAVADSHLD